MNKKQIGESLYQYTLILIILSALAYRGGRDFILKKNEAEISVNLENIKEIYPKAFNYTLTRQGAYDVYDKNSNKIGSALLSSDYSQQFGYGGRVPLLIGINDSLVITKIILLPNNETRDYIATIYGEKFIGKWRGVRLIDAIDFKVDIVSGATHTSNAVIAGVRHTASSVMKSDASILSESNLWTNVKDILFLSLMLLSVVMAYKKGIGKYRTIYLFLVLVIMGIIINNALSVKLLNGWLKDGFSWRKNWQTSVVFLLALTISFTGKRKFYCNYLCPMGALQELTNRFTPLKKRMLPTRYKGIYVRELYLIFIAGALLLGFTPELSYAEPFMFFSFRFVGIGLIIFGIAIILLSLFFTKPWCSVCPTGCLMDTISYKKVKNIEY
ncbi:MAG: 4Fe-4S binding protein [Bacteroidetes bacterium]|nr:4Fe-4S binding protein [Bacteroidota bacterium]